MSKRVLTDYRKRSGTDQTSRSSTGSTGIFQIRNLARLYCPIPASQTQIEQIGRRKGWRVLHRRADSSPSMMELWVKHHLMLEL